MSILGSLIGFLLKCLVGVLLIALVAVDVKIPNPVELCVSLPL